ncbi:pleckstrin domain-containing protein [Cavenderia fasciculata]|uniref:Pleckstrin domain-containing protein n=1 Tax=Cavenderia fasciculata TaxID=261658 RepID=F4Q657_CACFS|nr:pleckstrin domain-containing protein [Cavenderia fasciculata]EGG17431.1 pleckstrin domain-containing protein [Cavenderia fasciculata]|eukprot:XP_004355915.1 pleckstrin domain-containing protein [Cavenderia fasciculata]
MKLSKEKPPFLGKRIKGSSNFSRGMIERYRNTRRGTNNSTYYCIERRNSLAVERYRRYSTLLLTKINHIKDTSSKRFSQHYNHNNQNNNNQDDYDDDDNIIMEEPKELETQGQLPDGDNADAGSVTGDEDINDNASEKNMNDVAAGEETTSDNEEGDNTGKTNNNNDTPGDKKQNNKKDQKKFEKEEKERLKREEKEEKERVKREEKERIEREKEEKERAKREEKERLRLEKEEKERLKQQQKNAGGSSSGFLKFKREPSQINIVRDSSPSSSPYGSTLDLHENINKDEIATLTQSPSTSSLDETTGASSGGGGGGDAVANKDQDTNSSEITDEAVSSEDGNISSGAASPSVSPAPPATVVAAAPTPTPEVTSPQGKGGNKRDQVVIKVTRAFAPVVHQNVLEETGETKMRNKVINEIINTEKDYISDLKVIINVIYTPLKESKILQEKDISTIFSNVQFLLSPIQRLCKYPLLIRELIKNSDEKHPDLPSLEGAYAKIQAVVLLVNESKRKAEVQQQMWKIHEQLETSEKFDFLTPTRYLLREDTLRELTEDRTAVAGRSHYYLFNDIIMRTKKDKKSIKLETLFVVASITINDVENRSSHFCNTFELAQMGSAGRKFTLMFDTYEQKMEWMTEIETLIRPYKEESMREYEKMLDEFEPGGKLKRSTIASSNPATQAQDPSPKSLSRSVTANVLANTSSKHLPSVPSKPLPPPPPKSKSVANISEVVVTQPAVVVVPEEVVEPEVVVDTTPKPPFSKPKPPAGSTFKKIVAPPRPTSSPVTPTATPTSTTPTDSPTSSPAPRPVLKPRPMSAVNSNSPANSTTPTDSPSNPNRGRPLPSPSPAPSPSSAPNTPTVAPAKISPRPTSQQLPLHSDATPPIPTRPTSAIINKPSAAVSSTNNGEDDDESTPPVPTIKFPKGAAGFKQMAGYSPSSSKSYSTFSSPKSAPVVSDNGPQRAQDDSFRPTPQTRPPVLPPTQSSESNVSRVMPLPPGGAPARSTSMNFSTNNDSSSSFSPQGKSVAPPSSTGTVPIPPPRNPVPRK